VWYADDPLQIPAETFLDDAAAAGYSAVELGPLGYLPTSADRLLSELNARELQLSGVMLAARFHEPNSLARLAADLDCLLALAEASGAGHLILLPRGEVAEDRTLDADGWRRLVDTVHAVAHRAGERGLRTALHPHAETPIQDDAEIERFLELTDGHEVSLCLDTGHHAYAGGDPVAFVAAHRSRISYLHLKNVDERVMSRARAEGWDFATAVANEVFCLLERGVVEMRALSRVLDEIGYAGWAVVEQDMYPAPPDKPLPIARRNLAFLREIRLGRAQPHR
jgi:inosose dehydratase